MNFGCLPSTYDARDFKLNLSAESAPLPEEYCCPLKMKVKDQRWVASCVAHATSSILEYHAVPQVDLSTTFIYGIQKQLFNRDGKGMMLRDACKIAADYGDMLYEDCVGNHEVPSAHRRADEAFADKEKLDRASKYRILKYFYCSNNKEIKHALYNYGPVLASMKWYDNYTTDKDGVLIGEQRGDYGWHAIVIYGYTKEGFWCQNSWGKDWGKDGRFFVPNNIKLREARGFVDWNGTDELKEPRTDGIFNFLYKCLNGIVNFIQKLINR
jgi:C1A family cysteine protease